MHGERERCKSCGSTNFIFSTELEGNKWVWKRICKNCGELLETRTLK